MPIHVNWDDDAHTIIRMDYVDSWTWDEMFEALRQANALTDAVHVPVSRISDLRNSSGVPANPLPQIIALGKLVDTRMEMHITVGANRLVHMLADLFFRLAGPNVRRERYHWADSLEQARFMIGVYRQRDQDAGTGK